MHDQDLSIWNDYPLLENPEIGQDYSDRVRNWKESAWNPWRPSGYGHTQLESARVINVKSIKTEKN